MSDAMRASLAGGPAGGVDRRQFLYGGLLLGGLGATAMLAPRRMVSELAEGTLDRAVPRQIGRYSFATQTGLVLPPQDDMSARIYDQVLTRVYVADGLPPMMLLIAYGSTQDSGLQLHRPEICYPGAGYTIEGVSTEPLAGVPGEGAMYLTARRNDRTEQVYYWTRVGDAYPADAWNEKFVILRENLQRRLPDGVLVRVSAIADDRAAVLPAIMAFNAALIAGLGGEGRRILLGETRG